MSERTFKRIAFVCLALTYAVTLEIGCHVIGLTPGVGTYFALILAAITVYRRAPLTPRTG